jgi:hypothetical protein
MPSKPASAALGDVARARTKRNARAAADPVVFMVNWIDTTVALKWLL